VILRRAILSATVVLAFAAIAVDAAAGSRLGPDSSVFLAQSKGKGGGTPPGQGGEPPGGGGPPGGDPPGQGGTPPGQGGTPPGQQDQPGTPSTPATDHESGVHGTRGRDSSGFGSPSGLRGLDPVPQGR